MRKWDGYGWSSSEVDGDTELRLEARATHPRSRMQLNARVFCAVPALSRASADPEVESRLILHGSADTRNARGYDPIGEVDFDRFDPGVSPVSVDHIVPVWTVGGDSSRDIARSRKFRKAVRRFEAASDGCAGPADPSSPPQLAPIEPTPLRDAASELCDRLAWHRLVDVSSPAHSPGYSPAYSPNI